MAFLRRKTVYCIADEDMGQSQRVAFSAICITTASLSGYGAFTQLRAWCKQLKDYKSRRTPSSNPPIVFSLALADLFACLGVIGMSVLFLTMKPPNRDPNPPYHYLPAEHWYWLVGVPIEAFTMFAYIATYLWTLAYSVDICLQVYNKDKCIGLSTYQIICWVVPLWLVVWGEYGFLEGTIAQSVCSFGAKGFLHYGVCYFPLMFVTIALPIVYIIAFRKIHRNIRGAHATYTNIERQILAGVRRKFTFIVVVFMVCWVLNAADGLYDLWHDSDDYHVHYPLWMIEAVFNPLQGFLNCIVYGQAREMIICCKSRIPTGTNYMQWVDTPTSETSGSFLVNSQDIIEYSKVGNRTPLLNGGHAACKGGAARCTSPNHPSQLTFVPRLLGEPRRT